MSPHVKSYLATHVSNCLQFTEEGQCVWEEYLSWQRSIRPPAVKAAKAVLGTQSYCWTGRHRNWVWQREFLVPGDSLRQWQWALFASKRGFALEVQQHYPIEDTRQVAATICAVRNFLRTWVETDQQMQFSLVLRRLEE